MMTSHHTVMKNVATAVYESAAVNEYAVNNFGRGLDVHVGAYPHQIPNEADAPFLWITAKEENEDVMTDETFSVRCIVGACVKGENGEKVLNNVLHERSDTANGLTINGGSPVVEDFRDLIISVIEDDSMGAILHRVRRTENDIAHFPLEWAEFYLDFECLKSLNER